MWPKPKQWDLNFSWGSCVGGHSKNDFYCYFKEVMHPLSTFLKTIVAFSWITWDLCSCLWPWEGCQTERDRAKRCKEPNILMTILHSGFSQHEDSLFLYLLCVTPSSQVFKLYFNVHFQHKGLPPSEASWECLVLDGFLSFNHIQQKLNTMNTCSLLGQNAWPSPQKREV